MQKKSREKALARHDTVVRLLIRRYVTAEQTKRDQFAITEDDVREIRQDISSFRYELINILNKNGMRTPTLDKEDTNSQLRDIKFKYNLIEIFSIRIIVEDISIQKSDRRNTLAQFCVFQYPARRAE